MRLPRQAIPIAVAAILALAPASAAGEVKFKIDGRGFGHGIGMSQWGAYGLAKDGKGYAKILAHYYRGTELGERRNQSVRVLLDVRGGRVEFGNARKACGERIDPDKTYAAQLNRSGVRLEGAGGPLAACGDTLTAKGAGGKIRIDGEGNFRGDLVAASSNGALNVVNSLGLNAYVAGVVPGEMPTSWPADALRAQAVAARTYALATDVGGDGFDQYSDTRSQVYGGLETETPTTNRAVEETADQVVTYSGEVAVTYYSSTSGGQTENVENVFLGAEPKPWLVSVRDPADAASPLHRWSETYTRAEMEDRLSGLLKGKLLGIRVDKTGRSPRIVRATVLGSGGNKSVSGPELQGHLGLLSTWARFKLIR